MPNYDGRSLSHSALPTARHSAKSTRNPSKGLVLQLLTSVVPYPAALDGFVQNLLAHVGVPTFVACGRTDVGVPKAATVAVR